MTAPTPLHTLFDNAEARWERYGPTPSTDPAAQSPQVDVAALFDFVEIEYAAIRKAGSAALLDQPHRGTLIFTGADRLTFLNRMVTQELKDTRPHEARRAFWLSRKGRIDADLRLIILEDRIIADVDLFAAPRAKQTLESYIIADDVAIEDASQSLHRLALHGPGAAAVLASFCTHKAGAKPSDIQPGQVSVVEIAGHSITVDRWDSTGEIGLELTIPAAGVVEVFQTLLQAAHQPRDGHTGPNHHSRLKPIGWHAYNTARIEAGTPLYMLDFGPDALPGETGVLHDRVSFKKGCYLGQEIVARMHNLGQPKQLLIGLKFDAPAPDAPVFIPPGGAPIFLDPLPTDKAPDAPIPIGTIASSTSAPMLGGTPIAFAMMKQKHSAPGTRLLVPCIDHPQAEPQLRPATIQPSLTFWSRSAT